MHSGPSCLKIPSAGITGVCHHAGLKVFHIANIVNFGEVRFIKLIFLSTGNGAQGFVQVLVTSRDPKFALCRIYDSTTLIPQFPEQSLTLRM
jgi:hypothetical protein